MNVSVILHAFPPSPEFKVAMVPATWDELAQGQNGDVKAVQ
jgi:hypothetical protein